MDVIEWIAGPERSITFDGVLLLYAALVANTLAAPFLVMGFRWIERQLASVGRVWRAAHSVEYVETGYDGRLLRWPEERPDFDFNRFVRLGWWPLIRSGLIMFVIIAGTTFVLDIAPWWFFAPLLIALLVWAAWEHTRTPSKKWQWLSREEGGTTGAERLGLIGTSLATAILLA